MSKELLEEFEIKQKEEWKAFLQNKEFVPQLLNEAELYLESIQEKTIYDTLVEDLVKQVRKDKKFFYNQWKWINQFVVNHRKSWPGFPKEDDDFIVL